MSEANMSEVNEGARGLIQILGDYPPGGRMIDEHWVLQCKNFSGPDPIRFLRDLRDELVYSSGCADVVIIAISALLDQVPESESDMKVRRAELERKMGLRPSA